MPETTVPLSVLGGLLFTVMGPIGAIPMFAAATAGADDKLRRQIAFRAYAIALGGLAVAVFVGAGALVGWGVSPPALIVAGGLILTLTALRNVVGGGHGEAGAERREPSLALAFQPIAITGLVTPMGVAILVIFVSYFPATGDKLAIMAVAAGLMTLNLGGMLAARWFMRTIGPAPLIVLGSVFGVLQVAMGIQLVIDGLMRSPLMR